MNQYINVILYVWFINVFVLRKKKKKRKNYISHYVRMYSYIELNVHVYVCSHVVMLLSDSHQNIFVAKFYVIQSVIDVNIGRYLVAILSHFHSPATTTTKQKIRRRRRRQRRKNEKNESFETNAIENQMPNLNTHLYRCEQRIDGYSALSSKKNEVNK